MGFLIPTALALSALAIPIIVFYMLKLRRQPARVSSLILWRQVLQDRQANAPWQRLKRNVLLLLQLLILALLVMALARPYFTVAARVQGNVVLLLDASASMQATDVAPNRFAVAQAAALDLIDHLDPGDAVTLIAVESTPHVLAATTTDHNALRRALRTAQPGNGLADWETALTLAAANAASLPEATIVIISDGGLVNNEQLALNSLQGANLQFIPVGETANNQGLVSLSLRAGPDGPELLVRVLNAAQSPARRLVEIKVNDQLFDARWLDIPARDNSTLTLSGLPLAARQVQVTLVGHDDLPLDDVAWAVRKAAPTRVLLVGEGNLFLERALALLPDIEPQRATPDQPLPQSDFGLLIFDRSLPPAAEGQLPAGNLLFVAPPASSQLFQVSGTITQTHLTHLAANHPLLTYVEFNNLHVARAQAVTPPLWAQTVVQARGGPLLLAGQVDGRRVAILAFDLHQSDLPLQIDFPILLVNLMRWLAPADNLVASQTLRPGQGFDLPVASTAATLLVYPPSGQRLTISPDISTFNDTAELGLYRILAQDSTQTEPSPLAEFAVNLLSEAETDILPQQIEPATPAGTVAQTQSLTGRLEWWWSLVLVGFGLLLLEWWLYWRGEGR